MLKKKKKIQYGPKYPGIGWDLESRTTNIHSKHWNSPEQTKLNASERNRI